MLLTLRPYGGSIWSGLTILAPSVLDLFGWVGLMVLSLVFLNWSSASEKRLSSLLVRESMSMVG